MLLNGGSYVSGSASSSSWFGSTPSTHTLRPSTGSGSGGTARAISRAPKSSEAVQRRQTAQLNRAAQQFEAQKTAQGESIASAANRQNQVKDLGKGTDPNALRDPDEAAKLAKATAQKVQEKPEEGWLSQAAGAVGDGLQALWDGTCWVGQKIWDGIAAVGAGIWWTVSSIGQGAWWLTSSAGPQAVHSSEAPQAWRPWAWVRWRSPTIRPCREPSASSRTPLALRAPT